ncbi:MAG TPA: erythromycin esterase family protein [Firmicutes bacterium]|jgi:erythromycin esterase|nr:erythromycin esterase family protein [Bacillota bacterium]
MPETKSEVVEEEVDCQKEVIMWLKENAIRVTGLEAGGSMDDLMPLKRILGKVRVVGLGEATHGTREFFQFKHRLIEFLVKQEGFTVFAIEASSVACAKINEYVLYGQGERDQVLAGQGFWTWDTEEVSEMIEWMRQYNLKQPEYRKVRFYGYDVQNVGIAFDVISDYVSRVAPEYSQMVDETLIPVRELQADPHSGKGNKDPEKKVQAIRNLQQLLGILSMHKTRFIRLSSPLEYETVVHWIRVCLQYQESYGKPQDPDELFTLRDLYMAENIEYIAKALEPDARIVAWAHNGHIFTGNYLEGITSMGGWLREFFGSDYYALGLSFNEGGFQARLMSEANPSKPLTAFSVPPAREGTLDWYLAQAGLDNCIVDFRGLDKPSCVKAWLGEPIHMRSIGSGFSPDMAPENFEQVLAPNCFDGLAFISRGTRARPTPSGIR